MACSIARNSASASSGFVKNATAPAFIARSVDLPGVVARDEDDRHVKAVESEALLELETSEVRKVDVKDHATRAGLDRWVSQELLCRRECLRLPTSGLDQQFQRFSHRDVVVNDEHGWSGIRHCDDLNQSSTTRC